MRDLSLRIFDRAFLVTYALEAVAVVIGLLGVAFAASSAALARRGEFAMLRHVGMLRRQVLAMLAGEGLLTSLIGVVYGLVLGGALSLVLVYVINRQSFNWSVELAIPALQLGALSAVLVIAAALTATLSGRAAMSGETMRAVREDWSSAATLPRAARTARALAALAGLLLACGAAGAAHSRGRCRSARRRRSGAATTGPRRPTSCSRPAPGAHPARRRPGSCRACASSSRAITAATPSIAPSGGT